MGNYGLSLSSRPSARQRLSRWLLLGCLAACCLAGSACRKKTACLYDLEEIKKVDPARVCYQQAATIPLPFQKPGGLAAAGGLLYVTGDDSLLIINPQDNRQQQFPLSGYAGCLAAGSARQLYLGMSDHVEVYDVAGKQLDIWPFLGHEAIITSIAAAPDLVYVADAGNHVVLCFTRAGKLVKRIGEQAAAAGTGGFIIPSPYFDVAAAGDNSLWVAHTGAFRLEHYTKAGEWLTAWGKSGFDLESFAGCCNPIHFALLTDGRFVTAEKGLCRVKLYTATGQLDCVVAAPASFRQNTVIADLAADAKGNVYVLDPLAPAVYIFIKQETRAAAGKTG